MNKHLEAAIQIYGDNLQQLLAWHLCHGFVLCRPECFAIGFFSNSQNPISPLQKSESDSLFVTYCGGKMLPCLQQFNEEFKFVAFQREVNKSSKVRIWNYKKTLNRIK